MQFGATGGRLKAAPPKFRLKYVFCLSLFHSNELKQKILWCFGLMFHLHVMINKIDIILIKVK